MILVNSPANPTGVTATADEMKAIAQLAADRGIALVSDEIYRHFFYDDQFVSAPSSRDTGWRGAVPGEAGDRLGTH